MERPKQVSNTITNIYPSSLFLLLVTIGVSVVLLAPSIYLKFLLVPIYGIIAILGQKSKAFLIAMKRIFFLCLVVFVIQGTSFGTEIVFEIGIFKFKDLGIERSLYFMLLFSSFGSLIILYFLLVNLYDLCSVMRENGIPFMGAYIFLLTLQTIPLLGKKATTIMEAQTARGIEVEGNLLVRMKAYIPMFGPLLLSSIFSTEERAITLEARGFTAKCPKTTLYDVIKRSIDKKIEYVCILVLISVITYKVAVTWFV